MLVIGEIFGIRSAVVVAVGSKPVVADFVEAGSDVAFEYPTCRAALTQDIEAVLDGIGCRPASEQSRIASRTWPKPQHASCSWPC